MNADSTQLADGIAVIGMAGKFPGAPNLAAYWQNLRNGVESITHFSEHELEVSPAISSNPQYVRARGIMKDVDLFDAEFFGINPREAEYTDPQQRLLLETAWEALENAGYDTERFAGSIGVFAGCSQNTYLLCNLASHPGFLGEYLSFQQVGAHPSMLGNDKDFVATRIAYKLNLRGPSIAVQSACSTSLVAICQACQNLLTFQCDVALAGGVSVTFPQKRGYVAEEGSLASGDGRCRPFDAAAGGTVFGDGVGLVVLKRADEAIRDGDHIHSVIRGFAVNNDGSTKVSYMAPSVDGQAEVVATAQALAGIDVSTIRYVEAHGTGTSLGDPVEVAALTKAFRAGTTERQFCALGAVKGNIGHLESASGVAGLLKAILALEHGEIPPTLHFSAPNPRIDFVASPFYVCSKLQAWPATETPRRAGVSSFGVGGTNAHVVLEETPQVTATPANSQPQLFVLSAKTASALDDATNRLAEHLRLLPELSPADAAYTLQTGRRAFRHRRAWVSRTVAETVELLGQPKSPKIFSADTQNRKGSVAFLFPGQGAQQVDMGRELYETHPIFRAQVDLCCERLAPELGLDLRRVLYPADSEKAEAHDRLMQTSLTQPALFVVEYALAQVWLSLGVRPQVMLGHSLGEYVAAVLAGIFTLEDALHLLAVRGRLIQSMPSGTMLAVTLPEEEVTPLLVDGLSLAAVNGPKLCVVSGPEEAVAALRQKLSGQGAASRELKTSHGFHSSMMDPILAEFEEEVRRVPRNKPQIPIVSSLFGRLATDEEWTDPGYWSAQLRQTVRFADAVGQLLNQPDLALLEVGPGQTLTTLARQNPAKQPTQATVHSSPRTAGSETAELLSAAGQLWLAGVEIDWLALHGEAPRRRVPLPTYPFERKRHWIEPYRQPGAVTPYTNGTGAKRDTGMTLADRLEAMTNGAQVSEDSTAPASELEALIEEQLRIMAKQIEVLRHAPLKPEGPAMSEKSARYPVIEGEVKSVLKNLSGRDLNGIDTSATFFDLGFDSLLLTQASQSFRQKFGVKISFRQLLEDLVSIAAVSSYLDEKVPADKFSPAPAAKAPATQPVAQRYAPPASMPPESSPISATSGTSVERLVKMQLRIMAQQLDALRSGGSLPVLPDGEGAVIETVSAAETAPAPEIESKSASIPAPAPVVYFGPYKPVDKSPSGGLTERQQKHLDKLIAAYVAKTPRSKKYTGKHRAHFADPRTVAGFRNNWKEMVYPIVVKHSRGARFWDLDNNEYVDVTMGFGTNLFGHMPEFVERALRNQISHGIEVGPQSAIAGKVAALMCEFSGMERVCFCSTGSEAVLAAIRIARTVTGRTKIATMSGAYHGINDEVLIRGTMVNGKPKTVPVAPGIPEQNVQEVLVLDYGSPAALELLRKHAHELAAVLVEPVQSRHPELAPVEFLREVRRITKESETALVFDEIVTGFRTHPGGCQALFGIKADIATYGKVIGGGIPIGAICGKAMYMDALDGGDWQYGDASFPEIGMTFFAGTFVRHPLGIRSALSVLSKLKREGPALQDRLSDRCAYMVDTLNAFFEENHVPMRLTRFRSIMYYAFQEQFKFASLLFFHLRLKGLHVWEARPLFLSTAHTDEDIAFVIRAFEETVLELREGGFLPELDEAAASTPVAAGILGDQKLPLHEAQVGVWLLCNSTTDAARPYHEFVTLAFNGKLDHEALRRALQAIVDRHDGLRTTIEEDGRYQLVHAKYDFPIEQHDVSSVAPAERGAAISAKLAEINRYMFPGMRGPFLHASLLKCDAERHLLVLTFHHMLGNGPSYWLFLDELIALYREKAHHEKASLPEPMPLAEYVRRRQDFLQSEAGHEAEAFWLKQMEGGVPALELPVDYSRPAELTYVGTRRQVIIEPELTAALKKAGAAQRCSLFMVMLSAYSVLLHRLSGQDDLIIGVPFDSPIRMEEKDRNLFANTTNMIPLRSILYEGSSFIDHLQQIKNLVIEASEHQDYFFGHLIGKLGLPRDPSRSPFFNVTFNLESGELHQSLPGLEIKLETDNVPYRSPVGTAMYELYLNAAEKKSGEIFVQCDHNADLIAPETLQRWLQHYRTLLQGIVADPNQLAVLIPLMTAEEQQKLVVSGKLMAAGSSA